MLQRSRELMEYGRSFFPFDFGGYDSWINEYVFSSKDFDLSSKGLICYG